MPSIRSAFTRRQELIEQADEIWDKMAVELAALIPTSMQAYAREKGWIKSGVDGWWDLPEFLQHLVTNTLMGGCNSDKIREDELEGYGFANFTELEAALNDLSQAWSGLVRISFSTGEVYRWEVYFYADEFAKALLFMEVSST